MTYAHSTIHATEGSKVSVTRRDLSSTRDSNVYSLELTVGQVSVSVIGPKETVTDLARAAWAAMQEEA